MVSYLFGCGKNVYTSSDIVGIHYSRSSINCSDSFIFSLNKTGGNIWIFDASYSDVNSAERSEYEDQQIKSDDLAPMLQMIDSQNLILLVQEYKAPKNEITICDGDEYNLSFKMSDGTHLCAPIFSQKLINYFTELAENYCFLE